ncbi:penicillin-binding transpeptidase domain-containing protein [Bacillus sp. CGMCC 1.16607]|uniref:penicillin-binding transpeptidase domain-containing protein n=1 Tax=Bacillus sp. CGMCC 1.16607 TaxID=3351842 RepID=UPI00362993F4
MEDKLKNLRTAMDHTVLKGSHFNEEQKNKVRKRTKGKKYIFSRNLIPNILTVAFCLGLLMITVNLFTSNLFEKEEMAVDEKETSSNHEKNEQSQQESKVEIPDSKKLLGNKVNSVLGDLSPSDVIPKEYKGEDVILTVDKELQEAVETILEDEIMKTKKLPGTQLLDRAFVVMMDPNTGEILSLAGKLYEESGNGNGQLSDYVKGTYQSSYIMGQSITGATILTGFQTGVIKPGTVLLDEPIKFKGSVTQRSWKNMGNINELDALSRSSNVYMYKTAMAIGGANYQYDMPFKIKPESFSIIRNQFNLFGLGVKTGVDLPGESSGTLGKNESPGYLLDLSIGQLDTYTPLQLAQYVSTIANGGYRMKPQMVKEVRKKSSAQENQGLVISSLKPEALNTIGMNEEFINRVQEGFRQTMQDSGGTAFGTFNNKEYKPAGKTGVSASFYEGPDSSHLEELVSNLTLVGYAPHDKPEVAFSVVVPWAYNRSELDHRINNSIGERILDAYFQLKKERH